MPVTICRNARDNHWSSQKLSMEKSTIGNEPYIEKATVSGSFFVLWKKTAISQKPDKNSRLNGRISCGKEYIMVKLDL